MTVTRVWQSRRCREWLELEWTHVPRVCTYVSIYEDDLPSFEFTLTPEDLCYGGGQSEEVLLRLQKETEEWGPTGSREYLPSQNRKFRQKWKK